MVYEPYQDQGNAAVQTGVWQDWDAYRGGAAKWWINTGAGGCGQATPCTWATIAGRFPNATIEEGVNCGPGGVEGALPRLARRQPGLVQPGHHLQRRRAVRVGQRQRDDVRLRADRPVRRPVKDQCKKGGWKNYGTTFKNQGDCVSFVASKGKNQPNG